MYARTYAYVLVTNVRRCTYVREHVRTYVRMYARSYVRTKVRTNKRTHVRTYLRTYVRTYVRYVRKAYRTCRSLPHPLRTVRSPRVRMGRSSHHGSIPPRGRPVDLIALNELGHL